MPQNQVPAERGRFMTRISRVVEITGSREIEEAIPGGAGQTRKKTIWDGVMFQANGRDVDGKHEWEGDGTFRNTKGVTTAHDLVVLMYRSQPEPEPEPEADRAAIEEAAPAAELVPQRNFVEEVMKESRLAPNLSDLIVHLFHETVMYGVDHGVISRDIVAAGRLQIVGPFDKCVAEALVLLMEKYPMPPAAPEPPAQQPQPQAAEQQQPAA